MDPANCSELYDWSELHDDLLYEIAQRIRVYSDFLSFRCVCTAWKSVACIDNFRFKTTQIPWLMLAQRKNTNVRDFFDVAKNKVTRRVASPEAKSRKCYSSRGWLFTIARNKDMSISLLHPFSRKQIQLPGIITGFSDWKYYKCYPLQVNFIWKCVLSSCPSYTSDYITMVIFGNTFKLAYLKQGDEEWTVIDTFLEMCSDVIYHDQRFYAITECGKLMVFHVDNLDTPKEEIQMPQQLFEKPLRRTSWGKKKFYVVESGSEGSVFVVARIGVDVRPIREGSDEETYGTLGFHVFEVDLSSKKWRVVRNLGNKTLFLGHNSSFSIGVTDNSQCKPNCIYFTDDCVMAYYICEYRKGGGKDMGIYSMKDRSIIPHFSGKSYHPITPPMWVEQTFDC